MTIRAHFTKPIVDDQGNLLPGISVRVLEPGTTTPISDTLWADSSSSNRLNNPTQFPTGVIDFYLDNPKRVRLGVTYGALNEVFFDDVDVLEPVAPIPASGTVRFDLASPVDLTTPIPDQYTYTSIPAFKRGLVYRFTVTSSGSTQWALRVSGLGNDTGELFFQAVGIGELEYQCSWPWMYENGDNPQVSTLHLGIDNLANDGSTFQLTHLRAEVFLP